MTSDLDTTNSEELEAARGRLAEAQKSIDTALESYGIEEAINNLPAIGGTSGSADAAADPPSHSARRDVQQGAVVRSSSGADGATKMKRPVPEFSR
jgi:hypothetical protein